MNQYTELSFGSARYYATVMAPKAIQQKTYAVLALVTTLEKMLDNVSDPGVARLKIQWWKEQISDCLTGKHNTGAQHPLLRLINGYTEQDIQIFIHYLDALETIITQSISPSDESQLMQFCQHLSSPETTLFTAASSPLQQCATDLAISLSLGHIAISQNPKLIDIFLSGDITKQRLELIEKSQHYYQQAFSSVKQVPAEPAISPAYLLASCQQKLIGKNRKRLQKMNGTLNTLSPLQYFWYCRKAHSGIRRGLLKPL